MYKAKYFRPGTIEEACSLLSKYNGKAKIISGGTDLLAQIKHKEIFPKYLVDVGGIAGQDYITYDDRRGLSIGAQATISSIMSALVIQERFGILAQAACQLGTWQVRNRATIGGNLCNAAPSAETASPLMVLGARVRIMGSGGENIVPIENLFTGPGQTILKPDEILAEIKIPNLPPSGGVYLKHTLRKSLDLAIVGVAVLVTMDDDTISDVKIALGAVAPTPIRAKKAEEMLKGQRLESDLLEKAGQAASDESSPIDDLRASADYRRKMVRVLVSRAIKQAVEQAQAG